MNKRFVLLFFVTKSIETWALKLLIALGWLHSMPLVHGRSSQTVWTTVRIDCSNSHPTKICDLHSSEGIAAIILGYILRHFSPQNVLTPFDHSQRVLESKIHMMQYILFFCLTWNFTISKFYAEHNPGWESAKECTRRILHHH